MTIEKNGTIYSVRENRNSWTVSKVIDKLTISCNYKKVDFPTFEDLKRNILKNTIF